MLWDVDSGLTLIDKYLYADNDYVKAGALLACGVVNSGVRNECEPAMALLGDNAKMDNKPFLVRAASVIGYALPLPSTHTYLILWGQSLLEWFSL